MNKLNYRKMLKEIDELAGSEFSEEMEIKTLPRSKPFTQSEAARMAMTIGRIYSVSHCLHCKSCTEKYKV